MKDRFPHEFWMPHILFHENPQNAFEVITWIWGENRQKIFFSEAACILNSKKVWRLGTPLRLFVWFGDHTVYHRWCSAHPQSTLDLKVTPASQMWKGGCWASSQLSRQVPQLQLYIFAKFLTEFKLEYERWRCENPSGTLPPLHPPKKLTK